MTARHKFFAMLAVAACSLVGLNVAVARLSARVPARLLIEQLPMAAASDVLVLGNSLMAAGFDREAFGNRAAALGKPSGAFNASLGATGPAEHLAILHAALAHPGRANTLIYGFYDFMLTEPTATDSSEIRGNRTIILHLDPALAARHLARSRLEGMLLRGVAHIPLFVERESLWKRTEQLRRAIGGWGLAPEATNRWGRVGDFNDLEVKSSAAFRQRCREAVGQKKALSHAVEELFSFAVAHGLRISVVEAPMPSRHRSETYDSDEWTHYREHLRECLRPYSAQFIPAGDWMADDQFVDALHLGAAGAAKFSTRLASAVNPELSSASGPPQ